MDDLPGEESASLLQPGKRAGILARWYPSAALPFGKQVSWRSFFSQDRD
ncbi:MAG: hypothetical protein IKH34_04720 [Oscillospiraceae bacterium]|nr:hypothetical protein [Oscillospiraceae bacterium]